MRFLKRAAGCFMMYVMLAITCHSQDTSNTIGHVSIASPNAASLGKYGDIPVSYNTGIPNISIPLYAAESGNLKLPISLSYHASGLKVQENASWVGAGWSLNAGGVITRTVVGAPDDRGVGSYSNCTNGHYSDYGFNSYQFIPGSGFGSVNGMVADDQGFHEGAKDGEPDLYFFNFGNYTGKFYFNDDRTPILVPEQDFKIQPDLVNGAGKLGFQGFIVTTPDGTKYYFGKTGNDNVSFDPVEISTPSTLQNGPNTSNEAVSSWFLNKIISSDGTDSINLLYTSEHYSYYTVSIFPISNIQYPGVLDPSRNSYNLVKNFVQGARLTSISFKNGNINFTRSSSARTDLSGYANQSLTESANIESYSLGSVSISNTNGFCKKDSFYYNYFYDANSYGINPSMYGVYNIHSDQYRLRLDSMQEISCDATLKVPPYKFSYFTEQVPRKLSFGMDHWGFYNGATGNLCLVPTYILQDANSPTFVNGANRDAAWPAMRGGTLQKITYPTGGYTQLDFEANDTHCNYNTYTQSTAGFSAGYDGSYTFTSWYTTGTSADLHKFVFSSNSVSYASVSFSGSGGYYNIAAGATDTFYVNLPANTTYTITTTFNYPLTGQGISGTFYDYIPTTVSGNIMVGGLRIKTITNNDGLTSNNVITSYAYNYGGTQSSGILYSRPVYAQALRNDIYGLVYSQYSPNGCASGNTAGSYFISPTSISPLSTVQGNHIGYNQVQVSQPNNGYTIYTYYGSNTWDYNISDVCTRTIDVTTCSTSIPNYPAAPLPYEPLRGELKTVSQYNQSGHLIKYSGYTYTYANDPITTPGIIFDWLTGFFSYTQYNLQSAKKIQTQVIETMVDPQQNDISTTTTTYYGSNFHNQPTRTVVTTSTGDSLITNAKYANDFRISSCDGIPDSLPYYNTSVNNYYSQMMTNIGTCGTGWICRYDTFQDYRRNINLARVKYITYRRRSYSDPGNLLSTCYANALPTADTLLKPVLRLQNMYDNATIETNEWKDANLLRASFIRYDTSVSPLGYAYPGRTKLVNLQATSTSFTNASVSGTTISKDSRYVDESFYTFNNGNPIQVTPHDGIANSYIWDYLNSEPIAKASNAPVSQIAYTSFEADGKGNWTFTGAPVTDATSPTGGKCYSLAGGNIVKSGLTSAKSIVSFWQKTGASVSVTGGTNTSVTGKTINGWTYYEYTVTGATTITVSGSGYIDELRLYPSNAQMVTYTYTPLLGMTSACDVDNKITYYFYDGFGRLKWIKDQDLNIIKTIQYHYQSIPGLQY